MCLPHFLAAIFYFSFFSPFLKQLPAIHWQCLPRESLQQGGKTNDPAPLTV